MNNYFLISSYPTQLRKKQFKAYCRSRGEVFQLTILGEQHKKPPIFSGISSSHRGGRFYLLETFDRNILIGWNNKFVHLEDIYNMYWLSTSFDRKFMCYCDNMLDDIKVSYETIWRRWLNPMQLYEDLFLDNWEMFVELPSQIVEQFNKDRSPSAFSQMIKQYIDT